MYGGMGYHRKTTGKPGENGGLPSSEPTTMIQITLFFLLNQLFRLGGFQVRKLLAVSKG